MNFEHFLVKKISNANFHKNSISSPIIKIGTTAISIGIIVMIISFAIGTGMQKEIKDKISSVEGHINIQSFNNTSNENISIPINPNNDFINKISALNGVDKVDKISTKFGILRTQNEFHAGFFKGVNSDYSWNIKNYIIKGEIPLISEKTSNQILISKSLSEKLNIIVGDDLQMIFSKNNSSTPSIIKFIVTGIFNSGFEELDLKYVYGDMRHIQRINKWNNNEVSSLEIYLDDFDKIDLTSNIIYENSPPEFDVINSKDKYYSIFEWIKLFDKNIAAIFVIMIIVASINIVSILLVLILERINMIGILKALGATTFTVRKFFIYISMLLLTRGVIFGNLIALILIFIQYKFDIVSLDETIYYVDYVPVYLNFKHLIFINLLVLLLCFCSILIPSYIVSKINPKDIIKFD